jgi:hypothetical protein
MDEVIKSNTLTLGISVIVIIVLSIIVSIIIYMLSRPKSPGIVNVGGFDLSNMNSATGGSGGNSNKGTGEVVFNNKDIGGGDINGGSISDLDITTNTTNNNKTCGNGLNVLAGC